MDDKVLEARLWSEHESLRSLASESDILDLREMDPQHVILQYRCKTLVIDQTGRVGEADRFDVGIWIAPDYLRVVNPAEVITWLGPMNVFHPNIRPPHCCIGHIDPGTPLLELAYRIYEVGTFQNVMPDERDSLNPEACAWARGRLDRFPLETRPLKRRSAMPEPAAMEAGG